MSHPKAILSASHIVIKTDERRFHCNVGMEIKYKRQPEKNNKTAPKVVVIGGGTGVSVILKRLRDKHIDITAIVSVADDGGSSGILRQNKNTMPPGDVRNVLVALSQLPQEYKELFQYRFDESHSTLAGHALGNLIITAMTEMKEDFHQGVQILSKMMKVRGKVLPVTNQPLNLHAEYTDGTRVQGEEKIPKIRKEIERVYVTSGKMNKPVQAGEGVVSAILDADLIVLGPGSLYTSILPNLMVKEVKEAMLETEATVLYICNIMTQRGETENFSDADHVKVLHKHLGKSFLDVVLVNNGQVDAGYLQLETQDESLLQVKHDFQALKKECPLIVSDDFLKLEEAGVYHDGEKVAEEIYDIALNLQGRGKKSKVKE